MSCSLERMAYSVKPTAHSEGRTRHSMERMRHSQERTVHSREWMNQSGVLLTHFRALALRRRPGATSFRTGRSIPRGGYAIARSSSVGPWMLQCVEQSIRSLDSMSHPTVPSNTATFRQAGVPRQPPCRSMFACHNRPSGDAGHARIGVDRIATRRTPHGSVRSRRSRESQTHCRHTY